MQRVSRASVTVDGEVVGRIGLGLVGLVGVAQGDTEEDARYLVDKTVGLRIFPDEAGKFNRSLADVGGSLLLVSQFTLISDTQEGEAPQLHRSRRAGGSRSPVQPVRGPGAGHRHKGGDRPVPGST